MHSDDPIYPNSYVLEITEYGKLVMTYNDTNIDRFKKRCKEMIQEHLDDKIGNDATNMSFRTYTN